MTDERAAGAGPRRKTPWSVLAAAAAVFVLCAWMWNELRKDAEAVKVDRAAAAAKASASGRPQILGLDVIPQEAKGRPAASAPPSAAASAAASPSAAPSSSVAPSSSAAPSAAVAPAASPR